MQQLLGRIFPLNRSLTGDGVRMTLAALQTAADFEVHEVPSGTECYDWTVPDEWSVREAYLEQNGRRLVDFADPGLVILPAHRLVRGMSPLALDGLLAGLLAPVPADASAGSPERLANVSMQVNLARIAPNQLFSEATALVLDPRLRTVTPDLITPGQADRPSAACCRSTCAPSSRTTATSTSWPPATTCPSTTSR